METNKHNSDADKFQQKEIFKWQKALLPWFIIMPSALIAIFIYMASRQLMSFNEATQTHLDTVLIGEILPIPDSEQLLGSLKNSQQYIQWITLTRLEQESYYRRYNQGALLLLSRIFTKYLGFFTGMILAIVGAVFIIGKISEDTSHVSGSISDQLKFSVVSSSPGVIFAVLGTVLMLATILRHNEIKVQDAPLYLNPNTIIATDIMNQPGADPEQLLDSADLKSIEEIWGQEDE